MITEKIIKSFEQYTGDTTELSSEQELDLANKIYRKILTEKVWTFLLTAGMVYMTTGSGAAPLNVAGILMIKQ